MRKDIDIELVRDARNQITAFNVSYTSRDPRLAQQVTGELTNLFINQNLRSPPAVSRKARRSSWRSNWKQHARILSDQEDRVRQFKAQHVGEMPGQLASNLQILQGLQTQLQSAEDSLNAARQQQVYLQTLADQYRTLQGPVKSSDGTPRWAARDRSATAEAQIPTHGSQFTLHRSASGCAQGERGDRKDRKTAGSTAGEPEEQTHGRCWGCRRTDRSGQARILPRRRCSLRSKASCDRIRLRSQTANIPLQHSRQRWMTTKPA